MSYTYFVVKYSMEMYLEYFFDPYCCRFILKHTTYFSKCIIYCSDTHKAQRLSILLIVEERLLVSSRKSQRNHFLCL